LNCQISASAAFLGLSRCLGTLTTSTCIFLGLSRFLEASTTTSDPDPTILCVPGNFKPRPFSKVSSIVKPSALASEKSVISPTIFFPAYVPNAATPLVRPASRIAAVWY